MKKILVLFVLVVSFILCLHGLNWGRVQEWNVDQVAIRNFSLSYLSSFDPQYSLKPPFHSYFNYFLSILPATFVSNQLHLSNVQSRELILLWSRLLTVSLFLLSALLVFKILRKSYGFPVAFISFSLYATTASLIAHSHFLTSDIPVLFWSLVSFYFAQKAFESNKLKEYCVAGFLIGLATATKYNGLLVAPSLYIFYLQANHKDSWQKVFLNAKIFLASIFILVGFAVGNPFSILNYQSFLHNFHYLLVTEEIYKSSFEKGGNYLNLPINLSQLLGIPSLALIIISLLYFLMFRKKFAKKIKPLFWSTLAVVSVYFIFFGSYPLVYKRYLLVTIPFIFLMMADPLESLLERVKRSRMSSVLFILGVSLFLYNVTCSWIVGKRFINDARMAAQVWVERNVPSFSVIEKTSYVPNFNLLYDRPPFVIINVPVVTGRDKLFEKAVPNDEVVKAKSQAIEGGQSSSLEFFEKESSLRDPDYIAISNSDYFYLFVVPDFQKNYPQVYQFFTHLLDQKTNYKVVFDQEEKKVPLYLYPSAIDFLNDRQIIFKKNDSSKLNSTQKLSLTDQDLENIISKMPCQEISETCFEELKINITDILSKSGNSVPPEEINKNLENILNSKNDVIKQVFTNTQSGKKPDKSLFYSLLFYQFALDRSTQGDYQDIETFLWLSTKFSPYWSYFHTELANYYFKTSQTELARKTIQTCSLYSIAADDCIDFFQKYQVYNVGFNQEKITIDIRKSL